jgi:hypothetical protein
MKPTSCTSEERARVRSALRILMKRYRTQGELALYLAMQIARHVSVPLEVLLNQGWNAASETAA